MTRDKRFDQLRKVPRYAAADHRFFLDANGKDRRASALTRNERRLMKKEGEAIAKKYKQIQEKLRKSGVGYPIDQQLRDFFIEYTNRYATSGLYNQPASFNYFEPFCSIELIDNSYAPYTRPLEEVDHLFSVTDFFDYVTNETSPKFCFQDLATLPEEKVFNFTQNGSIKDFSYLNAEGKEFLISGFSMVRRGNAIHWCLLGGEVLPQEEWDFQQQEPMVAQLEDVPPEKRPFLSESMRENDNQFGPPVALQGTATAVKTIIAGETDLVTCKHVARCYMSERENSFVVVCDDPEIFSNVRDVEQRAQIIAEMNDRIASAGVMWDLAEAFFRLVQYFQYRLTLSQKILSASGERPPRKAKSGRGVGADFKHVTALEISETAPSVLRAYAPPKMEVETDGHWRRLKVDQVGQDRDGNQVQGKTWIKEPSFWRSRPDEDRTVYIKSSVAAARIRVSEYVKAAEQVDQRESDGGETKTGVLYVMRCVAMEEEIYKVGWTSNSAAQRARELSSATGVPISFVVVNAWQHRDPKALEKSVHALLDPYRLNESREFFRINYAELKKIIENEILRSDRS